VLPAHSDRQLGYHSKSSQEVTRNLRQLDLDPWLPGVRRILSRQPTVVPRILVTGAKGSGKSSLCRVLTNRLLALKTVEARLKPGSHPESVLYLDLDPGHPELAAPGVIYLANLRTPLLGPAFTNVIVPGMKGNEMVRMHYIGAFTPQDCPAHYQNCVSDLLSLIRDYEYTPLVVNTCGWDSTTHQNVLQACFGEALLTDIVQMGDGRNSALQRLVSPDTGAGEGSFTLVPGRPTKATPRSGRGLRDMQLQSYLHASVSSGGDIAWDQLPIILSLNTTMVDERLPTKLFTVVMLDMGVVTDHLLDALDGSVAAVVVIKHGSPLYGVSAENKRKRKRLAAQGIRIRYTREGHLPYLDYGDDATSALDPRYSECLGLGLVTISGTESRQLRIRSPILQGHVQSVVRHGNQIALVVGQQHGLWYRMESVLAREARSDRFGL
jgi:polynucleotide 5'-hydroxyl-kinase GRC3/NOL9